MNIIPTFIRTLFERNKNGDTIYYLDGGNEWGITGSNLHISQNHPILTPAMLFVSKVFSQAEFKIINTKNGKEVKNHWMIDKLNRPNFYQTKQDFLESSMFLMIAQGKAVVYSKKIIGMEQPEAYYLLNSDLIKWPYNFKTKMFIDSKNDTFLNTEVVYDVNGENKSIKIKDLLFFYDLPNCLDDKNFFKTGSRIDGLKQTLINTADSLTAKNIILKTNGKELITGDKAGFPLGEEEKLEAESLFNTGYGLGKSRKRGLITKANLTWKSLHIALRDLGLDESVKVDGNLIYTALHIPKDILSLEAKKTTYNNFKESMVSYIQNEIQSSMDAFTSVLQREIEEPHFKLVGNYEHLPIMQFVLIERYDGVKKKAEALKALLDSGIPSEIALEMCGFDRTLELTPPKQTENGSTQPTTNGAGKERESQIRIAQ